MEFSNFPRAYWRMSARSRCYDAWDMLCLMQDLCGPFLWGVGPDMSRWLHFVSLGKQGVQLVTLWLLWIWTGRCLSDGLHLHDAWEEGQTPHHMTKLDGQLSEHMEGPCGNVYSGSKPTYQVWVSEWRKMQGPAHRMLTRRCRSGNRVSWTGLHFVTWSFKFLHWSTPVDRLRGISHVLKHVTSISSLIEYPL